MSMVDQAGASKDAPVSMRPVVPTPSGSATNEIGASGGGVFTTHLRLPYGNDPHP
ncbi:ash family protein [Klebsiella michiganensis]